MDSILTSDSAMNSLASLNLSLLSNSTTLATTPQPQTLLSPWLPLLVGPALHLLLSLALPAPDLLAASPARAAKWKTTFIARLHAGLTGLVAAFTLWQSPSLRQHLMDHSSPAARQLVLYSVGSHLAEAVDMVRSGRPSMLALHHLLTIASFVLALTADKALGFAVLSLLPELNAVFNKTRILHLITETPTSCYEYVINSHLNLATFFVRILIIGWMNNQCFLYYGSVPLPFLVCSTVGLSVVNLWNLSVFKQLIQKDLLRKVKLD